MQTIIKELVEKAGLSEAQADKAILVMKEFIQGKLPPGFSAMVDNFFATQNQPDDDITESTNNMSAKAEDMSDNATDGADDLMNKIKGMFGGNQ